MPNTSVEHNYPGNQDREQSADEFWSDRDSDNNHFAGQDELNGSRALKRKRPLTVSYVIFATWVQTKAQVFSLTVMQMRTV